MEKAGTYGVAEARDNDPFEFVSGLIGRGYCYPGMIPRITWGIATEAWSMPGAKSSLVGGEFSVLSLNHDQRFDIRGADLVFKNRRDGVGSVGQKGENRYNENSRALNISSQPRSSDGEYCGWQTGIYFDKDSLDRTASKSYTALMDFSEITDKEPWMMIWGESVKYGMKFNPKSERVEFWRDITGNPKMTGSVNMKKSICPSLI